MNLVKNFKFFSCKFLKYIVLFVLIVSVALVILEFMLIYSNSKTSYFQSYESFHEVDELLVYQNYITDEHGVYRYNPLMIDSIKSVYLREKSFERIEGLHPVDNLIDIYKDFNDLLEVDKKSAIDSEFAKRIQNIKSAHVVSFFDSLLLEYARNPFNESGFRSIPFVNQNFKPKILLVGDSFVHGASAWPIYNSFFDILLSRGFVVYSAGISGTDPAQYLAVIKAYIKQLEPDLIIVSFYEGNDLMYFYRDAKSGKDHEHITNAGFLSAYPIGIYMDANEAYQFVLSTTKIPQTSRFNKLFSKSILGTKIWAILFKLNLVNHPVLEDYYTFHNERKSIAPEITNFYLSSIDSLATENNVPIVFSVIPDIDSQFNIQGTCCFPDTVFLQQVFKGIPFYYSNNLNISDFPESNDFHFNNSGHRKYADFLEEIILKNLTLQDSVKIN
jgi:hypothetical protein